MKKIISIILSIFLCLSLMVTGCKSNTDKPYTITFMNDTQKVADVTLSGQAKITFPEEPVKDGYIFGGWFFDKDSFQNQLKEDSFVKNNLTENINVYAKWTKDDKNSESETDKDNDTASTIFTDVAHSEGKLVSLVNDDVKNWCRKYSEVHFSGETKKFYDKNNKKWYDGCVNDTQHYPRPLNITFNCTEKDVKDYVIKLSLDKTFKNDVLSFTITQPQLTINDLLVNKTYYWTITANFENKESITSPLYSFITYYAPRTVAIEGVSNSRDLGGANVVAGEKIKAVLGNDNLQVKQQMIYRSASINSITKQGMDTLVNKLGIRHQVDLRKKGEYQGQPEIKGLTHLTCGDEGAVFIMGSGQLSYIYKNGATPSINPVLVKEINYFADESNYPLIFNCSAGRDRTGCLAFILQGLLGVEKTYIYRDYEFGCFSCYGSNWGNSENNSMAGEVFNICDRAYKYISTNYPSKYFSDSVYNYLSDMGVSEENLNSIIRIMLEKA